MPNFFVLGEFFMETAGIICEYNPFHRGHRLQLEKTRREIGPGGAVVCLMSGRFVQRGEPAVFAPELRARAAVLSGADLVLELPITGAVNAAGYFAKTAVECLSKLGCITMLSFGSEWGNLTALDRAAGAIGTPEFDAALREALRSGCSYAAARTKALGAMGIPGVVLESPNNALGVEYIRALRGLNSEIRPWTYQRDQSIPTATALREKLGYESVQGELPWEGLYRGAAMHKLEYGERAMLAVLRSLPDSAFEAMAFESEGIFSKVRRACRQENSLDGILAACKSRRFAYSRLRRTLMCLFLGLSQQDMDREIPYLRVLAFNDRGRQVLGNARKESQLPLISGAIPRTQAAMEYFNLESRAADLYTLFAPEGEREPWDLLRQHQPVYIQDVPRGRK